MLVPGWTKHWNAGLIFLPTQWQNCLTENYCLQRAGGDGWLSWWCGNRTSNKDFFLKKKHKGIRRKSFFSLLTCFSSPCQEWLATDLQTTTLASGIFNLYICHFSSWKMNPNILLVFFPPSRLPRGFGRWQRIECHLNSDTKLVVPKEPIRASQRMSP